MSEELKRLIEQNDILHRLDPTGAVRSQLDLLERARNPFAADAAVAEYLRRERVNAKMLAQIADMGKISAIHQGELDAHSRALRFLSDDYSALQRLIRLPELRELGQISHGALERTSLARLVFGDEKYLQAAMAAMQSPWLQVEKSRASAAALAELVAIGRGINELGAFNPEFSTELRYGLGDWRDAMTPAPEAMVDVFSRSRLYVDRGFNSELTEFTPVAFREGLRISGLSALDEPGEGDGEEHARSQRAFDLLRQFEIALRRFICEVMHAEFGEGWMQRQLPQGMYDTWVQKRATAVSNGGIEEPLIAYADFADYKQIIERRDNWAKVFKGIFGRPEDVRESFQRLYPVRIATMHARPITHDDELLLVVETRRVRKAIVTLG